MKIGKYAFNSEEQGELAISKFENEYHCFARLGTLGGDKWHVDVCWQEGIQNHPHGWKSYSLNIDTEGVHSFAGLKYLEHKFDSSLPEEEPKEDTDANS
tara:strand:- start:13763 stop:14059 length:297 start_codon:yes stop_codon:yes gene_type:complete